MRSFLKRHNAARRDAYRRLPSDLREHHGIEQTVLAGGYGYRQVMELIQNGADAILEAHEHEVPPANGDRIRVLLRGPRLYAANTGAPLSEEGLDALLSSHSSPKRANQIGRFGLGFKSLLRLGGPIDVFTRNSGAIRFDPARCREELKREFNVTEAPGLRLAWPLPEDEQGGDPNLGELTWAETIVRIEVQTGGILEHLRDEIRRLPSEFLLFFPVPVSLFLEDGENTRRELRLEPDGDDSLLHDGSEVSRWRVAKREVSVTDAGAIADATHIHARDRVPLAWAIPLEGKRDEAGVFWAFFPTRTETRLAGILNAPWKVNSDRNAVIGGEWNTALMEKAAQLVVESLPTLRTDTDPGRPLDAFPRQVNRKDEDAAPLVEALWSALESAALVPDATGVLRPGRELWRHPREHADIAWQWQAIAGSEKLVEMVHPSCLERQRGSRLNALADRLEPPSTDGSTWPNLRERQEASWFAAVASADPSGAVEVLKLAEAYSKHCAQSDWKFIREKLAIIPSDQGDLLTASQAVFAPEGTHIPSGRHPIARALRENSEAVRILDEVMGVRQLADSVWLEVLGEELPQHETGEYPSDERWFRFWSLLRSAPETVRQRFAKENAYQIRVRRCDGKWALPDEVLLPGAVVDANDTSANRNVLFDAAVHGGDQLLLKAIGVSDSPQGVAGPASYDEVVRGCDDLSIWLDEWRSEYFSTLRPGLQPQRAYIEPRSLALPRSWMLLPELNGVPNAKLTETLLLSLRDPAYSGTVRFGHATRADVYPINDVPHPLPWFLLNHGTLRVGEDAVRLTAVVARRCEPALATMPNWGQLKPPLEKLEGARPPVTAAEADIDAMWRALIKSLATPLALEDDSLRELWAGAAKDGVVPRSLRNDAGEVGLAQVFVTSSPHLAQRARTADLVVVTLDEHALQLWIQTGARDLAKVMSPTWTERTGPACLLVSTVPELGEVLRDDVKDSARCQPVAALNLVIDGHPHAAPCLMWDKNLLLDLAQLSLLSRAERLQALLAEIAAAGWIKHQPAEALCILGDAQIDALRMRVAQGGTLAERLLLAVGNREEPLRQALGGLARMDFIQGCRSLQLAELALAQLGPATLSTLKDALEAEGLKPPERWNTAKARAFVADIGFPAEFAASREMRRESEEFISGPIELPPLHDFQEEVLEGIRSLVTSCETRRRAVVSLPTGGGKTLVTVEAAVLLVLKPEGNRRNVLWVAQTDELCEQAVQAFRQVWLNLGARRTDLRIVRQWGGNPNPAIREPDKPVVVVASIQTLNSRIATDGLAWLKSPGLVVVDECHHAITKSYTSLLRWLDVEAPKPAALPKDEPPILGLSATPFRMGDEESQRLARRFDSRWLPANQERLYVHPRHLGALAEVDNEALESGADLLPEEIDRLSNLPEEGIDLENLLEEINQRLAGSEQRNERLVDRVKAAREHSILFFANSVLHAGEMSARLNLQGISAAAVSGNTPPAVRRYFVERFQRGEIRVLCNHSVLSAGFDAPKTDMVLVSRAVFSPVRYMQMVGRGLRGVRNGGTARCRIVTVLDNLGRFLDRHPYHYCQRYFTSWSEAH